MCAQKNLGTMRRILFLLTIIFYSFPVQAQEFDSKKMRYIEQFKYWAMDEQIRTGVPAAISLAQGILETGSGTSELCTEANNHFGIKCKKEWTGETFLHDDDKRHECFRKYKSSKDSYIDHSNFLKDRAHYGFLFDLETTDYQAWCKGLKKAGYATNPQYAGRLIQLIEKYNLQQYTYEAIELAQANAVAEVVPEKDKEIEVEKKEEPKEIVEVVQVGPRSTKMSPKSKPVYDKLIVKHGRNGFWARKGDYLLPEAVQYNIRYAKLLAINDLEDEPLYDDMFIYLKRKAKKGDRSFHKVQAGETMHSISQDAGVQLKNLYVYNNLYDGEEPAVGEKIYLQGRSTRTPKLRGTTLPSATTVSTSQAEREEAVINVNEEAEKEISSMAIVETEIIEKEDVIKQDEIIQPKKSDAIVGINKELETEQEKRTIPAKEVEKEAAKKEKVVEKLKVVETKPSQAVSTKITAVKSSRNPIINLHKAKKVEELMGDGSKEIERLYMLNQQFEKEEKVIPAPQSNNKEAVIEKVKKTDAKRKKAERKYDDENVSDDVKNLKKKFDSLIYDED